MSDLIDKTINGSIWAYGAEIIAKVITPISFLILTRVISPEDYGIVAVATTVLMFVNILSDFGTSQVIIQTPDIDKEFFNKVCNTGFIINITLGILLFCLVELFSENIADYYKQPNSRLVIQIMSIQIIFISLSSIQNSLKRKNLDFKYLFFLRLLTILTPIVIAIPIAFAGGGLWAIVTSNVVGTFLQFIFLWKNSLWKPAMSFSTEALKYLFTKSIWNSFNQLFIWIPISMDTYLIGKYMNSSDLGLYTTSRNLFTSCSGLILAPIIPVVFSSLSKVSDSLEYLKITYNSQKILFSVSAFFAIFVFLFAENINYVIFNSQWQGITPILQVIFLIMGLEYFGSVIYEAVRATGRFRQMAISYFISLFFIIPILYLSAREQNIFLYSIFRSLSLYIPMIGIFIIARKEEINISKCISNNWILLILVFVSVGLSIVIDKYEIELEYRFIVKVLIFMTFSLTFYITNRRMCKSLLNKILEQLHIKKS